MPSSLLYCTAWQGEPEVESARISQMYRMDGSILMPSHGQRKMALLPDMMMVNFGTQVNITREQIVTLLYRYANYVGLDTSQRASLDEYVDGSSVSSFAKDAMEWALAVGIIQGQNNQGIIDPQGKPAVPAGATIFMRFCGTVSNVMLCKNFCNWDLSAATQ